MQARGYSLVEIIVVICIVSILLAIGTLRFSDYLRRYRAEAQTGMIYQELMQARANAVYQRRDTRLKFYSDCFEVYSSKADKASGVAPVTRQALSFPIMVNSIEVPDGENVDFAGSGVALNLSSICIAASDIPVAVDSVVIGSLKLRIGKKKGTLCNGDSINSK